MSITDLVETFEEKIKHINYNSLLYQLDSLNSHYNMNSQTLTTKIGFANFYERLGTLIELSEKFEDFYLTFRENVTDVEENIDFVKFIYESRDLKKDDGNTWNSIFDHFYDAHEAKSLAVEGYIKFAQNIIHVTNLENFRYDKKSYLFEAKQYLDWGLRYIDSDNVGLIYHRGLINLELAHYFTTNRNKNGSDSFFKEAEHDLKKVLEMDQKSGKYERTAEIYRHLIQIDTRKAHYN
ncbi:hypothetical protein HOD20_00500 [archaeon]|jgi:hypothetical protein|nr:hypothetical protein [archaeon]MBT4350981.1 hypothetical protein [archaeon]MBT4647672.1 hypothetical protein [archaeon]MBT6822213.1 hypothetical protein [archaeon]MBT7391492.1 hypothetical protein [archaeon]